MNIIIDNWAKFKKTKVYMWYKKLPVSVVGLTTFLAILVFLTAIFNWFWTGTGVYKTRTFYAPFTNDFKEFQDYATLYIALIAFGASMFAALAVFLVFNDWKDQYNQSIDSKYYDNALEAFKDISITVRQFKLTYEKCKNLNDNGEYVDILQFIQEHAQTRTNLLLNLDKFQGELIFLQNLTNNEEKINQIEQVFTTYISEANRKIKASVILTKNYSITNADVEMENDLSDISTEQGTLIKDNIKSITTFLNENIKA